MTHQADSTGNGSRPTVLRRRWRWVAFGGIVALAAMGAHIALASTTYTSSASVLVKPQIPLAGGTTLPADMTTQRALAASASVIDAAAAQLKITPAVLRTGLSVSVPASETILRFSDKASSPAIAQARAQATATAYADQANSVVAKAQQQLAKKKPSASSLPLVVEPVQIISNAPLPQNPDSHDTFVLVIAALLAGLGIGTGLAFLADRSRRTVGITSDADGNDQEVIGEVPAFGRKVLSRADGPLAAMASDREVMDAYRRAGLRMQLPEPVTGSAMVLVTAARSTGDSIAAVAIGLGLARVWSGQRVALVGADLTDRPLARLFGLQDFPGVADLLDGSVTQVASVACVTGVPGLTVVPEGASHANSTLHLGAKESARALVEGVSGLADVVIVVGPAVTESAEALSLAAVADLTVLSVCLGAERRGAFDDAVAQLADIGISETTILTMQCTRRRIALPAAARREVPGSHASQDGVSLLETSQQPEMSVGASASPFGAGHAEH